MRNIVILEKIIFSLTKLFYFFSERVSLSFEALNNLVLTCSMFSFGGELIIVLLPGNFPKY